MLFLHLLVTLKIFLELDILCEMGVKIDYKEDTVE